MATEQAVVRAWAAEISRGDVSAATGRFAVPAEIRDARGSTRLVTRRAVRFFNESLPCGARLIRTRRLGRLVVADFRLVERPGGDCGAGAGELASAAFVVRDGLITSWTRLPPWLVARHPGGPGEAGRP